MTLLMPMTTWDTINTLCFDRKVVMVGIDDGDDAASIAQAAHIVQVHPCARGEATDEHRAKISDLAEITASRRIKHVMLLHTEPALHQLAGMAPGQFEVALYNPGMCGPDDVAMTVADLAGHAHRIIVVGDGIDGLWGVATAALPDGGYTASSDRSAIFITMGAPEPIVRQD